MTIGEMVVQQRRMLGISRQQLSKSTGIDQSVLWNIERGYTLRPRNQTLAKIADALGLDVSVLVSERQLPKRRRKDFDPLFRECREAAGYSRGDAADLLRVDEKTLYRWEAGVYAPTIYQLIAMSRLYDVPLDQLVRVDSGRRCTIGMPCAAGRRVDYCCLDCPERDGCGDKCLNNPQRCGLVKGGD